eukprot:gnl/TRDRNA2_/TRDRNA2_127587_c0_seq1.p1 gnl/TRDRNA2_/TRDRNA2_127587_c0~~gnl/TRDRNA2_/TRDRNA2_127587_c0_seq1.p1  ORF type:complete len:405 (-),score=33.95 gnl/TRDRNA2_/TRDRNA2_127587_c0_seq1:285-1424(-)
MPDQPPDAQSLAVLPPTRLQTGVLAQHFGWYTAGLQAASEGRSWLLCFYLPQSLPEALQEIHDDIFECILSALISPGSPLGEEILQETVPAGTGGMPSSGRSRYHCIPSIPAVIKELGNDLCRDMYETVMGMRDWQFGYCVDEAISSAQTNGGTGSTVAGPRPDCLPLIMIGGAQLGGLAAQSAGLSTGCLHTLFGVNGSALARGESFRLPWSLFLEPDPLAVISNLFAQSRLNLAVDRHLGRLSGSFLWVVSGCFGNFAAALADPHRFVLGSCAGTYGLVGALEVVRFLERRWGGCTSALLEYDSMIAKMVLLMQVLQGGSPSSVALGCLVGSLSGACCAVLMYRELPDHPSLELLRGFAAIALLFGLSCMMSACGTL